MAAVKAPRATVSGFSFSLGLATFQADLMPVTVSKSTKSTGLSFTSVCPHCDEAHKVKQEYRCTHDEAHDRILPAAVDKALEIEGALKKVDPAQYQQVKTTPEEVGKHADFTVYPAGQIDEHTVQIGTAYRLRPKKGAEQPYVLFMRLVENERMAFLCEVATKGVKHLFRAIASNGQIMLVELARPEEVYAPAPVTADLDERLVAAGEALVEALVDDFDPALYADQRRERLNALRSELGATEALPAIKVVPDSKAAATDLLALLERSVKEAA